MKKLFDSMLNYRDRILDKIKHCYVVKLGPFIRAVKVPPFPQNLNGEILVHIGCGELNDARYINIDARAMPHVHHVCQNLELSQFAEKSVDLIYACHVLEHLPYQKILPTLANWLGCLKVGGILRLSVPNFDTLIEIYNDNGKSVDSIRLPLMGGQEYDFNYHLSIFNPQYLSGLLGKSGFSTIREWDPKSAPYYNFDDWAGRKFIVGGKEYKLSLNLEAIRK